MFKKNNQIIVLLVIGLISLALPVLADIQAGINADKQQDYDTAFKELSILAKQDNTYAQLILGIIYAEVTGFTKQSRGSKVALKKAYNNDNKVASNLVVKLWKKYNLYQY